MSRIVSVGFLICMCTGVLLTQSSGWAQLWGPLPQFSSVSAVDDSTCWFSGDRAFVVRVIHYNSVQWKDNGIEPGIASAVFGRSATLAWVASGDGKIYRTTDGGATWGKQYQHPAGAAAFFNGLYFWNDSSGLAWGDPPTYPATGPYLIVRTDDGGATWTPITSGVPSVTAQYGITQRHDAADGYFWFATVSDADTTVARYIFRTRDRGLTWDTLGIPQNFGNFCLTFRDSLNGLIMGGWGKIAETTDGGATWTLRRDGVGFGPLKAQTGTNTVWVQGYFDSQLGYAPIFRSTDFGKTWTKQLKPTPVSTIAFSVVNGNSVWASGFNYLILRTQNGGVSTSVASESGIAAVPIELQLGQNYPNPFNPTTSIKYFLKNSGSARLVVYDMLGRRVRVLIDETQTGGWHMVAWDGRDDARQPVATGAYFYRLENTSSSEVKRMLLLK